MTSTLHLRTLSLPTAPIGPPNPLPPIFAPSDTHQVAAPGDADAEMLNGIRYGRVRSVLPYLLQDGYDRSLTETEHEVAVLENEVLKATFLLGAGGRLVSLVHRPSNRELLFRNPAFQPANLALRNAWVSGGVEWNIGTIGHSPLTCEPLHAVRARHADGSPVLRMYEYERLRGVVFQIDAWLPEGSPVLLVHVRIVNPSDATVPIYWWSNIAVPLTPDVRVVAPADAAWQFGYDATLRRVQMPVTGGIDRTYPTRSTEAADYFFDIPATERGWIAALDAEGTGLAQVSTRRLRGRKLFLWGQSDGGRHWQEWLNGPGHDYLEIQAGLARTQLEHLPLPPRAEWSWVEAYGMVRCPPDHVHGSPWSLARDAAARGVEELVTETALERALTEAKTWVDDEPLEVLSVGSGWGALERTARARSGDDSLRMPATPFSDSTIGPAQQVWLDLLDGGDSLPGDPCEPPLSYEVDDRWVRLLGRATGWRAALHRGVAQAADGDFDAAETEWAASAHEQPNAWAVRNLGALARFRGELGLAVANYRAAHRLRPDLLALTLELLEVLLEADEPAAALAVVADTAEPQRAHGRLRFAEARAALATGDLSRVSAIIESGLEIADIREGETSLTVFWDAYQDALSAGLDRQPMPRALDFRMKASD
ncbi:hypothetical protein BA895_20095 [Humibacillus sp. DSM 29435]|uniref:DUF5107 domain-containing protein n=1 Tax=Humibacillus sp. DSM 29435 TaxID=1869167 RepID=UPI000872676C|nr:DUF5107 domain-containing protein [Humibacillus sp. DSM 29435]OFE16235.1 hypothetical protein BA895_20095 [Humibacillus sp. DSM 29435]